MRARTFLLMLACALPGLVPAQYLWLDPAGRRVYSDQPPPPGTPPQRVLRQPGPPALAVPAGPGAPAAPATAAASAAPAAPPPRAPASAPQAAEARSAQEARQAEAARIAAIRADNCTRARSAKATLDSGQRIARMNERGEREILDDGARAEESRRVQAIIDSDCAGP